LQLGLLSRFPQGEAVPGNHAHLIVIANDRRECGNLLKKDWIAFFYQ
jgi:hypothetical protein